MLKKMNGDTEFRGTGKPLSQTSYHNTYRNRNMRMCHMVKIYRMCEDDLEWLFGLRLLRLSIEFT